MQRKKDIPWRQRKVAPRLRWWTKIRLTHAAWAGVIAAIGAVAAFVLTHGVDGLKNVRELPTQAVETYHSFLSWYYDDKHWTGVWSSREEGDIQDYRQAELPLKLSAETQRGKVNGEAFNLSVCKLNPLLPPILIEGEIRRGKMYAYAFAYVGGEKKYLYSFQVQRSEDEPVVTLLPIEDPMRLLPQSARLVQRAEENSSTAVSLADQHQEHPDLECPESPMEYMKRMREEERRGIGVPGKREGVQPPPDRLPNTSFKRTPDGAA